MSNIFISVVCASRDEENDILALCESFHAQDYPHKELIIVDDSSDKTKDVVQRFINKNSIVDIIVLDGKRDGCCPARNFGVEKSKGEVICYMTADSYFPNNQYLSHINIKFEKGLDAYMPNSVVSNQNHLYADFIHCWQQKKFKIRGHKYSPLTSQGYCVKKRSALSVGLIDSANGVQIPFNVCRDWTLIKKMDEQGFIKEFEKSYFVPHVAPGNLKDFLWTHTQRGVISGGYNLFFRRKKKGLFVAQTLAKICKSLAFYLLIFPFVTRAVSLLKYSSHNRNIMDFVKCDVIKTFSFHYGEMSVLFKINDNHLNISGR